MLEEKVADTIYVAHLHIRASQEITLLIASGDTHSDVSFKTGELISLRSNHADDVTLLALDAELANGGCQVTLLVGRHCGADDERAQTAKGQEKLRQCLIFEDELHRLPVDENTVLLILIKEVNKSRLIIASHVLAA